MKNCFTGFALLLMLALASPAPALERGDDVAHWDFDVYLNDKKVGQHSFEVSEIDGIRHVRSEARFNYKILFISAYRYEHNAAERWVDNCLTDFSARTNANGERLQVSGRQTDAGFLVESDETPAELPECVMTFAYWNPDFLEQQRLLNPQTGEYVDVSVEVVGGETLDVRGQKVNATRFRLTADEVDLTLWYSTDNEWLALESIAEGGHVIRYELS